MESTKYSLVKSETYIEDYGIVTTFGIQTTNLKNNIIIKDISTSIEKVNCLVKLCNDNNVSPIHLKDIIDDYIS